jgi:4-hydroxybenzoate polyprenyltransferase
VQRGLAAVRVVHPFPSLLNAALVAALAGLALVRDGATPITLMTVAGSLALGMLGLQFCIGAVNDALDAPLDAISKPAKPIPRGLVSRRTAIAVALAAGGGALLIAGAYGTAVLLMALGMLGAGLVYDAWLKPTPFAWLCYSVAFPILPVYAWYAATGSLPPHWQVLLPVAALAGPGLQLANGLVDLEGDRSAGLMTLSVRLGRRRAVVAMSGVLLLIYALAWSTIGVVSGGSLALTFVALATALALLGLALSSRSKLPLREAGWQAQCLAIALLGVGWLLAA